MKKLSLFMILTMLGTFGFSQVIFQVQAPSTPASMLGSYTILDWALQSNGWSSPDMNIPANAITGELIFVNDGDTGLDANNRPAWRDGCTPLVNGAAVSGKIAVINRGACEFGLKAKKAQNEGAIGVIIVSHLDDPIGMLGGDSGLAVTIPVIIIKLTDGNYLEAAIDAGTITQAFIGNKYGAFTDDLGSGAGDVLRARRFSNLAALSTNASEFSVPVGAWVRNFGTATQTGAQLKATIDMGGQIYADSAVIPTVAQGDSVWVSLSTFSQSSYAVGYYDMKYTITTNPNPDGEQSDNIIDASFMINNNLYSYGRLDTTTYEPLSPTGYRAGTFTSDWEGCLAFQDPNASRMEAYGMTFSASTAATDVLTGEFIEARVYQWDDVFVDLNDAGLGFANLTSLDAAFYVYNSDLQDVPVYQAYTTPIALADNQRYLFCLNSSSTIIYGGYDSKLDYTTTQDDGTATTTNGSHLQPSTPGSADAGYFLNGFGLDVQPAISINMVAVINSVDEIANEITINPFPNPTTDVLNIPVGDMNGSATIEIFDIAGKLVISNNVTFNNNETLKVDLSAINNGSYVGKMVFENGATAKFNVVVTR
jgi:hypothetical protein